MSDNHAVLLEQEIADLKGRLAEAVVQENEATRLHSQQHSSVMMYSAHHTEQQLRQDLLHNQIMSQIAQNKLTLMTRLRRAETDLNMLRLQQQQQQQSMLMAASQAPSSPPHMLHHHPGPPFMQPPVPRPPIPPQQPVAPPPPHTLLHHTEPHLPPHAVSEFPGPTSVSPYQRHPAPRHYHPSGANRFHRPLSHTGAPPRMDSYRDPMQHPSQRYPSPHHSTPPYPSPEVAHRAAAASNFANARDTDSRHAAKSSTSNDVIGYQRELLNQHDDSFRRSAPPPHERGVTSIQQPPNAIRENENNTSSASCYSSSSSSVSPSKEFFINNRELFNKARYDSEPEYREWCLKYNIVSVNDHGIKKQFGNIDSHSNDADYRSSNSHTRGDSDFRQRTLPPRNSSHFETDAPKVAEDIDDRVVSRLSHFSHRPLSSDSSSPQKQRPHEPGMSSSTTHSRSLAPSYSREERRGDAPMLAERDKEVSTSKFEQEFFDENHGPEPGHPYYHIWYNKFIKKPPPPTPATHSRHSPSSVCGGRKQDSDYRHSRGAVEVGRSSHGMEGGGGGARSSDNIRHHNSHHPVINSRRSGGHSYRHEEELIRNLTPPPKSRYEPHGHMRGGGTDMDLDEDHRHHPSDPMLLDPRHPSSSPSLQVAATPPPPLPPPPPAEPPPEAPEKPADVYQLDQMLSVPGRVEQQRLRNTLIIIRGPPGAGKSYIAKLIKDKEVAAGMTPPRILSIDDYFMVADESGKSVGGMVYEYEEDMEEVYLAALAKAFSKTVGEGKDRLVVIDACNHLLKHFQQFVTIAQHNLIKVFVIEMLPPVEVCLEQNVHKRTEAEIRNILDKWEDAPNTLPRLDASHFMKKQQQQQQKNKNNPPANDASCDVIKTNSSSTKQTTGSKLNGTNLASSAGKKSSEEEDVFCEDVASTCETNAVGSRKRQRSDSLELSDAEETSPAAATKQDWKHASRTRHSKPGMIKIIL